VTDVKGIRSRPGVALAALCLATSLLGCSGSSTTATGADDPLLPPGGQPTPISQDCRDAFSQGHDREAGGEPTVVAFLPSVQRCSSVAEWTATARARNVNLNGRDAAFIDGVCSAAGADTQARPICREAKTQAHKGP
jgi:hypothetical protein